MQGASPVALLQKPVLEEPKTTLGESENQVYTPVGQSS